MKHKLLVLAIAASLAACGGGGGSSKSNPPAGGDGGDTGGGNVTQTGVFLDSPVAGIGYRTETQEGVTNALGEYEYLEGETVTFFIGNLAFPPVKASGVITPADIAAGNEVAQTNMLQVLQTLDDDGDPSNGIQIKPDAGTAFQGAALDVTAETFDDEAETLLGRPLVSEEAANEHFELSLHQQLLGSWVYSEGPGKRNVLTFVGAGAYIIIHEHDDAPGEEGSQKAGSVEFGNYEWDPATGEFVAVANGESDGWGGLYDEGSSVSAAKVDGSTLTLTIPGEGEVQFTRVASTTNPLIGAWFLPEVDDNNMNILTFLSDSEYVIAHTNNQESYTGEEQQPLSGEFGTYSLSDGNFQALSASVDTDGPGGLYNAEDGSDQENETMQVLPWGELRFGDMNEGSFSFARIGSFAATLQDFNADGKLGTIQAARDFLGFIPDRDQLSDAPFRIPVNFADGGTSAFDFHLNEDGTASVAEESDDYRNEAASWKVDSTGAIVVQFSEEDADFTVTIVKLLAPNLDGTKVLLSLQSTDGEDSLWESTIEAIPAP